MGLISFRHTTTMTIASMIVAGLLAGATATPKTALADRNGFYVQNRAEVDLTAIYVSPIFSKRWRDDRLAEDALAPGGRTWVTIDGVTGDADCFFDIRVEASDGEPFEFWGVDLCTTRTVTVP